MPRKPMSNMTDQDFTYILGALNLTQRELGSELGRVLQRRRAYSRVSVTRYANGTMPIPKEIADALHSLCEERLRKFYGIQARHEQAADQLRAVQIRVPRPRAGIPPTKDRIMGKQHEVHISHRRDLPPYRLTRARYDVLVPALASWHVEQKRRHQTYSDDFPRMRDATLEIADIKAIVGSMRREPPYDMRVTNAEADVCFRALRWHAEQTNLPAAISLYNHWRKHRGTGYPIVKPDPCGCRKWLDGSIIRLCHTHGREPIDQQALERVRQMPDRPPWLTTVPQPKE